MEYLGININTLMIQPTSMAITKSIDKQLVAITTNHN